MKAALLVGTLAISMSLCAQTPNRAQPQANPPSELASHPEAEAILRAELIRGLDARKAKPGDAVLARCEQDVKFNGETLIPRNAKLLGHVVEVQTKGHGKPESTLTIAFDKAITRDGRALPLTASIQAIAPPSILAEEGGEADLHIRNTPRAKPRTSNLLPGAVTTTRPEASASTALSFPASSPGEVNIRGLELESNPTSRAQGSVIHSSSDNVRLDSGTRLILRVSLP